MKTNKDYFALEAGQPLQKHLSTTSGRCVQDLSGRNWKMEKMRIGQGVAEGIHLLKSELSGNNFSWNAASVPGDVYTDLYLAGELEDPYFGRNMHKAKWVQEYEWWYNRAFNVEEDMIGKDIQLVFEGVDYSCEVWLNGTYLGTHEGMYSSFSFTVTDHLIYSQPHVPVNLLTVKLDPPPKNQQNFAGMKHNFAGDYLTGLIPFGIWQSVKLIGTQKSVIENYRCEYDIHNNLATAHFDINIRNLQQEELNGELQIQLADQDLTHTCKQSVCLSSGDSTISCSFDIEDPKLWWPYDLGEPFLYNLTIQLTVNETILDSIHDKTGIRTVTMQMNPGFTSEESQIPWTFTINGKTMFLRSACWGGQPSFFYGRNSSQKYRMFLENAKEANINNLRIFGWHPAETKEFYDICDELGITVWTNFSFATQEFRTDQSYLDKVTQEIQGSVISRRNHPSNIMWMGGEEVFFTEAHVESGNKALMQMIGKITNQLTNVPYADASPLSSKEGIRMGYATKESAHANSHYYAAGAIFMEDYYPNLDYCIIPELTAASAPSVESLRKFIPQNELWPMGLSWGYHAADIDVLKNLNYEVFGDTRMGSLEEFVEATQISQGTVAQFALEHFRRQKPHVSGVALCHFITNWPIIKWDIIDYYGTKKKSFDYVKRSYQPLLPSLEFSKRRWLPNENFSGNLYIINDYYKEFPDLHYVCEVKDCFGNTIHSEVFNVSVKMNSSKSFKALHFTLPADAREYFTIHLKLFSDYTLLSENEYRLLIADQEEAKKKAYELYTEMHKKSRKYGKGYYRYFPQIFENL